MRARVPAGVSVVLALVVLGPALARGFVLSYDMVFVPSQPLVPASVGLGPQLPRAVPVDAVVALLSAVLGGEVLQKLVLLGALVAAGTGAGLLASRCAGPPGAAARVAAICGAGFAIWNPWVAQRLLIGHWSLLLAYAVLPWIVLVGWRSGMARGRRTAALVLLGAVGALTPTGGVLTAVTAVVVSGRRRATVLLLLALAAVNAPWWVPGALHAAASGGDPAGFEAFALRAETWAGPLVSAVGLGGIWNADVVTPARASLPAQLASLVIFGLALAGVRPLVRELGRPRVRSLMVLAGVGLALALATALPGIGPAFSELLAVQVPGAGLLRDSQKWLALAAPFVCLAAAVGVVRVGQIVRVGQVGQVHARRTRQSFVAVLGLGLAVLTVPDLAWGAGGRLEPVTYPPDWAHVRDVLDDRPGDEVVAVLPFQAFRAFAWNGKRTVLDPAPRWFRQHVVVDDSLPLLGLTVRGESAWADRVRTALADDGSEGRPARALAAVGVDWVLVERSTPGTLPAGWPGSARLAFDGDDLGLYRLSAAARDSVAGSAGTRIDATARPPAAPVYAADAVAVLVVLTALARLLARTRGRSSQGADTGRERWYVDRRAARG